MGNNKLIKSGSTDLKINVTNPTFTLKYVQKSADTLDQDLLEALGEWVGPGFDFIAG